MIASSAWFIALALAMAPQADERKVNERYLTSLKLEISTIKDTLDPIDLLQFTVRFTNTSGAPLRLELDPMLRARAIVRLVDPEGRLWFPETLEMKGDAGPLILVLNPGEFFRATGSYSLSYMRLLPAGATFRLPQAGTWKVWAEYGRSAGILKTNEATIQVKESGRMSPKGRELFGSETWHRFNLGGAIKDSDLVPFRKFVLSGVEEGQRDLMAFRLGALDANPRPGVAMEMLNIALDSRLGNLDRVEAMLCKVDCLWRLTRLDEALALLNQVETDPKDFIRRRMEKLRAGIMKSKGESAPPAEGR